MGNYIKIERKILDWEWYKNLNTCRLFFHLLLKANWKDGRFEGESVPTGSFVSSISKLSDETGLTQREVRTAINHLKMTRELTVKGHAKYSVFTINNYCQYQDSDKLNDKQATSEGHSNDIQTTTIETRKKERREENKINNMCKADALALFEKLWKLYPSKKGKGQVSLAAKQRLLKVGYEEMARAIDRYILGLEKDSEWRKPQNGSTFFNSGYVDYLDDNYVGTQPNISIGILEAQKSESEQNEEPEEELIDDEEWWKYGPNAWEG